jgi:hypothetical protein
MMLRKVLSKRPILLQQNELHLQQRWQYHLVFNGIRQT